MDFTFGIITGGGRERELHHIITSIEALNVPNYEIIIVGSCNIERNRTRIIPFDEHIKPRWITRKKNIITKEAHFDNIVYTHDYITYETDWYNGFLQFGSDFKICMTKMLSPNGERYRDWTLWAGDVVPLGVKDMHCLIPYDMTKLSKFMYISGAYWVAKKDVMLEFPLDESRVAAQSEDVEWSKQVRNKYNFSMNPFSTVRLLKTNSRVFTFADEQDMKNIQEYIKNHSL